jgi:cytidine deaminase
VSTAAQVKRLLLAAQRARASAYAPYSRFRVGASVLTKDGDIFAGCNVENATFGATLCAERSALAAMIAAGHRTPVACAVVTGARPPAAPCGICRQVLSEFAPRDLVVILASEDESGHLTGRKTLKFATLFPQAFRLGVTGGARPLGSGRGPR